MWWVTLLLASPTLTPWSVESASGPLPAYVDRYAITRLDGDTAPLAACNARVVRSLSPALGMWLVESTRAAEHGGQLAARLTRCPALRERLHYAVPNLWLRHRLAWRPSDPRYPGQWYLEDLAIERAWDLHRGDPAVTIVVVDNGCQGDHPDLASKLDPGRDVIDADDDPSPESSGPGAEHGTACAGIVGAATDNALGIAGTCPKCRVRCVRMLPTSGELVPISADVDAFQFALDVDAAVVSNSWGFVDAIPAPAPLRDIIEHVHDNGRGGRGAVVVFAAGNDDRELGDDELTGVRGVLNIGAVNTYGEKTPFTNYGASLDIVAPAGTVTTDLSGGAGGDGGDYTSGFGGTSSACPVAAGVAGLLLSAAPQLSAAEATALLIATTAPAPFATPNAAGHDPVYGFGVVSPVRALERALGVEAEPDVPAAEPPDEEGCAAARLDALAALLVLASLLHRRRRDRAEGLSARR